MFHCFITYYLHEKKMKRGCPVSTGRSHNKKAKTYATMNKDRNPLSQKQSASAGSAKKITDFMKVSSKKPNPNNDKNTTVTNNINDPVKNITNNGNNIVSSITNIDLASTSIDLPATDFEIQEQSGAGEPQLSQIEPTGENTKSLERTAENNPIEPLDEPSEIEPARQNTKSIEREEENNPGESSSGERVPETISKKSSKETNKKSNIEDSPKFKEKILLSQKRFEWFEYWFGEGTYCSTCRTCALPSEKVFSIYKVLGKQATQYH